MAVLTHQGNNKILKKSETESNTRNMLVFNYYFNIAK